MAQRYLTDLTDAQWALVEPLLPPAKRGGRPRTVDLRLVLNTIFYLNKTGCQWALLPNDLAKRSTANDYFTAWKADGTWQALLDALRRRQEGQRPQAPPGRGFLGPVAGGAGHGGQRGRWHNCPRRPQAAHGGAPESPGGDPRGWQVQQPHPGQVPRRRRGPLPAHG